MLTHPKGLGTQFLDTQSNGSVSDGKFFSFHSYGIALKKLTQGDELHNVVNSLLRRATLIRAYPLSLSLFTWWSCCCCKILRLFKKWANPGLFFVYFRLFPITISIIQIEKSIDGVLGIWTRGHRIIDTDDTTELCAAAPDTWTLLFCLPDLLRWNHFKLNVMMANIW